MSASSEEDYHSAEEEGGASDATRLSRGLEGARLSENDGDDGALGHAAGSSSGEQTELRGTTEPHVINRTPASNEEEASSDHGEGGEEKSASPSERETQELTEEEIMVNHTHTTPTPHSAALSSPMLQCTGDFQCGSHVNLVCTAGAKGASRTIKSRRK